MADVLNPGRRRVVVKASKEYGPTHVLVGGSTTVTDTRTGSVSWKLTLTACASGSSRARPRARA
jgi:hypothetical protein